ncbi:MAG: c-type cytochrome [Cycloclasticus sp.]|nr:c-type cytochrome [Cycloclasticus sp.]
MRIAVLLLVVFSTASFANDYQPRVGANGAEIYAQACAACHGADGSGKFSLFFDLTSSTLLMDEMKEVIQKGGFIMPSFANIKGAELDALVAYVRSLGPLVATAQQAGN